MGLQLPQDAFEAVLKVPVHLVLPEPNDAADLDEKMAQIAARADADFKEWKPKIKELLKSLPIVIEEHLQKGGKQEEVLCDLERFRDGAEKRLEKTVEFIKKIRTILAKYRMTIGKSHRATVQVELVYELMQKEATLNSKLLDSLTITIADIDPESRGGPTFDNADDLIAYLDR